MCPLINSISTGADIFLFFSCFKYYRIYLTKDNVNCDFTLYNTLTFYCSNLCFSIQTNRIHSSNTVTKETLNFMFFFLYQVYYIQNC